MGVESELAARIVPKVMAVLTLALDTPDISLEDRTAACLVAERVMVATTVAILQEPPGPTSD
jgi:hypothetical protein